MIAEARQLLSLDQKKLLILAAVAFLLTVSIALTLNQHALLRGNSDVFVRWYATTKLFGEGRNLYDIKNHEEAFRFVHNREADVISNFYYPAHLLVFLGPLALLPYPVAHLLWTIAVQWFYLLGLWLLMQILQWPTTMNRKTMFMVAAVLFVPSFQHTIWGQFNTIGLLSLVACYVALRNDHYGLAGAWATGLTFKPQATLLTLLFLLFWAFFQKARWRFYLGFATTGLSLWLFAELLQPGWVFDFLGTLGQYVPIHSVLDRFWNPHQLVSVALVGLAVVFLFLNRETPVEQGAFAGCLALTLAVWALVVPIFGMLHVVVFPAAVLLLLGYYRQSFPFWYRFGVSLFTLIYVLGWIGFLAGFSSLFAGQHIFWSELAYKVTLPIIIAILSLPLCLSRLKKFAFV